MSKHLHPRFVAIVMALTFSAKLPAQQARIRVTSAEEMPHHTYAMTGSASELVQNDVQFAAFAKRLEADLRADLAKYEIADAATLKRHYGTLSSLALLDGRYDVGLAYADTTRALQDKPGLRAVAGTLERALAAAALAPATERHGAFTSAYRAEIIAVPWDVAEAELKTAKGRAELASPAMFLSLVQRSLDPAARSGAISGAQAAFLVNARFYLKVQQPVQHEMVAVLSAVIAAHNITKPDIWVARDVSLEGRAGLTPVVVGIWDSGTDVSLFADRVYTNPKEVPDNGVDDDGNGFVDDVHGIVYDVHSRRTTGVLFRLTYGPQEETKYRGYLKGQHDIEAGVDSREASEFRKVAAQLGKEEYNIFQEGISQYNHYAHGTHVAGIAVAGNPAARVLVGSTTFDRRMVPELPTIELAEATAKAYRECVEYMRAHGARVVNMSWMDAPVFFAEALAKHNVGTPEERRALARQIYDIQANALYNAIKAASDILFVAAAGNTNNDNRVANMAPASFVLPNLITVAAVDRAGDEAAFTSYGKVEVYANGFQVLSYVPGGEKLLLSGTSMATPQVTNLAAKLLAVKPSLTVAELRRAIIETADEKDIGPQKRIKLLNPKAAMQRVTR